MPHEDAKYCFCFEFTFMNTLVRDIFLCPEFYHTCLYLGYHKPLRKGSYLSRIHSAGAKFSFLVLLLLAFQYPGSLSWLLGKDAKEGLLVHA